MRNLDNIEGGALRSALCLKEKVKRSGNRYLRRGECVKCGWCCEYRVCPEHLSYKEGKAVCGIYGEHPLECQRFPQAPPILNPKCGYYFLDTWEDNREVKFGREL